MPDYGVEFQRYAEPNLPVCGIGFEEAVDFFLHFDEKDFENPRLAYKKESFLAFYNDLDNRLKKMEMLDSITAEDLGLVERLLENGLPDSMVAEMDPVYGAADRVHRQLHGLALRRIHPF